MKRLTVHLKKVGKKNVDGKYYIKNTLSFLVNNDEHANSIVTMINERSPKNNVKKWYLSNIK